MPAAYHGLQSQRASLMMALRELHERKISDQSIVDRLHAHVRAGRVEGIDPHHRITISRATIQRYRTHQRELSGARDDQVNLLFRFLSNNRELVSSLTYASLRSVTDHELGPMMHWFARWLEGDTSYDINFPQLVGTFYLYHRPWTARRFDSVVRRVASVLRFGVGLHMFIDDTYFDTDEGIEVAEREQGFFMPLGRNVLIFSKPRTQHAAMSLYAVHETIPDGADEPVHSFTGTVMHVRGRGPHTSVPFFAERAQDEEPATEFYPEGKVPERVLRHLGTFASSPM